MIHRRGIVIPPHPLTVKPERVSAERLFCDALSSLAKVDAELEKADSGALESMWNRQSHKITTATKIQALVRVTRHDGCVLPSPPPMAIKKGGP